MVIVKVPESVAGPIKKASGRLRDNEVGKVSDQLMSAGAIRPGERIDLRFRVDPIAEPHSLTSRASVIDPDGNPDGTQLLVATPFSTRRN